VLHKEVVGAHRKKSDCWFWQRLVARLAPLFCNTASSDTHLQSLKWLFLDLFLSFIAWLWLLIHIWTDRAARVIQVNEYNHPTSPLFTSYYDSSILHNTLHLFLYPLTTMVNSIRHNTDCHKTPRKLQFVEGSHSLVIWKPFSLSTLLLSQSHTIFY